MIEISVVFPTHNRQKVVEMALRSFDRQTTPGDRYEVVIVDDGSRDQTVERVKKLAPKLKYRVVVLSQKKLGCAAARNKAIKKAQGKVILHINDDTIAHPDLIKKHLEFHQRHPNEKFGLLGYVTWHPELTVTPFMYWLEHGGPYFSFSEIEGKEAGWERFWTCNISLKKKFLLENGLFDEEFPTAAWEDVELGYRLGKAGLQLLYDKKAIGYHYHLTNIHSIKNKMLANGRSALLLKKKMPQNLLPPLAKFPKLFLLLDAIFFLKPVVFLLEQLALFAETRFSAGLIFNLVLLHYRIKGLRE